MYIAHMSQHQLLHPGVHRVREKTGAESSIGLLDLAVAGAVMGRSCA